MTWYTHIIFDVLIVYINLFTILIIWNQYMYNTQELPSIITLKHSTNPVICGKIIKLLLIIKIEIAQTWKVEGCIFSLIHKIQIQNHSMKQWKLSNRVYFQLVWCAEFGSTYYIKWKIKPSMKKGGIWGKGMRRKGGCEITAGGKRLFKYSTVPKCMHALNSI